MTTRDSWIDKEEFKDLTQPLLPPKKPQTKRAASRKTDASRAERSSVKTGGRAVTADELEERILREAEGLPFGEPGILGEAPDASEVQNREEAEEPSPEPQNISEIQAPVGAEHSPAETEDEPGIADVPASTAEEEAPVDREQEQEEPPPENAISLPKAEEPLAEIPEAPPESEAPVPFPRQESERAMKSLASAREAADRAELIRKAAAERILGGGASEAVLPLPQPDFTSAQSLADRVAAYAAVIESEVGAVAITIRDESGHPLFLGAEAADQLGATASLRRTLALRFREVPFPSEGQHFVSQIRLAENRWLCLVEAPDASTAGGVMIEMVVPEPLPRTRAEQLARMLAATLRPGWAA